MSQCGEILYLGKRDTFTQCWFNVCPLSTTLAQHRLNVTCSLGSGFLQSYQRSAHAVNIIYYVYICLSHICSILWFGVVLYMHSRFIIRRVLLSFCGLIFSFLLTAILPRSYANSHSLIFNYSYFIVELSNSNFHPLELC